jgi:DNA-binding ferritin-like protein (Dps family)
MFDNKLTELKQYVSTVDEAFKNKLDKLGEDFEEYTKEMTPAQRDWYAEWEAGEAFQLAEDFPALMWQTAFIQMYIIFEHSILDLCEMVRRANRITEQVTGQDKGITAARKFLTKAGVKCPIDGPMNGPIWRDLRQMNELRIIFIHRMGQIYDKPSDELREFVERKKETIKIDSIGRITLTEKFCLEAIELVRKFYAEVLAAVPDESIP